MLKPSLFIKASSSGRRKTLGASFPACPYGVTVPTSVNPKPDKIISFGTSAFLSKPAARPIGLLNIKPNTSCFNNSELLFEGI